VCVYVLMYASVCLEDVLVKVKKDECLEEERLS